MLGTPVGMELFSADARFARDEDGEADTVDAERRHREVNQSNSGLVGAGGALRRSLLCETAFI